MPQISLSSGPGKKRAPATNHYRQRERTASPFQKKATPKAGRLSRLVDLCLIAVVGFCLVYTLAVRGQPKVVSNTFIYHPKNVYVESATREFSALRDRTKITFDEAGAAVSLKKEFPEISTLRIELPIFGERPVLHLLVAVPELILSSSGQSYVISSDGVAVGLSSDFKQISNLPTISDQSGFKTATGLKVLGSSEISLVNQLIDACKASKIPIAQLTLPPRAKEIDLQTKDKPYIVKFNLDGDPKIQIGQFLAARHQFANGGDPASYLDVRVAGKIFYK